MSVASVEHGVPHFVGRYEVLAPIASGGMATVYLARSLGAGGFERYAALKLTHMHLRDSPEFQSLLIEEAKLASLIRHPNVVSVLDVGEDPLGVFLVMDYVEGDTFSGLLRRARMSTMPMPQRIAMHILLDALAGLHAAHETSDAEGKPLNIVHRDFSPQNILVGTDGIAKLTDFGIAKAASRVGNTSTGVLKGKIAYMSPDQARGLVLDRRADVWAAGVLAWEIVAGRALWPREAEGMNSLIKLVTQAPPRLKTIVPTVSDALDAAVAKALAMDPVERWPSALAFAKAIANAVEHADGEEVAAYVRTSVGSKIEHRREQIRAISTLRAKIRELTEVSSSEHTPPGDLELLDADNMGVTVPGIPPELEPAVPPNPDSTVNVRGVPMSPSWAMPLVMSAMGLGVLVLLIASVMHGAAASDVMTAVPSVGRVTVTSATPTTGNIDASRSTARPPATTVTVGADTVPAVTATMGATVRRRVSKLLAPNPF